MATSAGKWEVVGKGGKPRKHEHGNKKNKAKPNDGDMPKLDMREPIPESKTQFDAFSEEQLAYHAPVPKKPPKNNSDDEEVPVEVAAQRKPDIKKRSKHHIKEPRQTLQEIVTEAIENYDTTSEKISDFKQKYENNRLVMLKELIEFWQQPFESMSLEKDPVLTKQNPDFPLCCFEQTAQDIILEELRECNEDEIDKLFVHCLDELLIEINKGRATYGIRAMIQCLVKCSPFVAMKYKDEHLDRVVKRKNNSRESLSLLWAFGQTSEHDSFVERIRAWATFFLPFIEFKQLSKYVVDYLEVTLSLESPKELSDALFSGREFQCILEIAFGTPFQQFPYRRQLQLLYPEVKATAFAAHPNTPLTSMFYHLFDSLNNDYGQDYTQEVLSCLVECLEKDPTCHYKWRNNYLAHLKESGLLLKALVEQWESVCRSIPRKYLVETLRQFAIVNEELKERDKHKTAGLSDCETSCNSLLQSISSSPIPGADVALQRPSRIVRLAWFLFWVVLLVICMDLYKHNGYEGSKTSFIFKRYGIEKSLNTTYQHSKVYVHRLESWTAKHYPHYYKKIRDVVEPASDYTVAKLHEFLVYLVKITAPAREYINKTLPPLLEKLERFLVYYLNIVAEFLIHVWLTYSPLFVSYAKLAWNALAHHVPLAWARTRAIAWNIRQWVYNLSPEFFNAIFDGFHRLVTQLVTRAPHVLVLVQEYALTAWKLVVSGVSGVVVWCQTTLGLVAYGKQTVS